MNSDEKLVESLETAARVIKEADLPAELEQPAFEKLLESLLHSQPGASAYATPRYEENLEMPRAGLERAARRLKVEPALLERVVDFDDDRVHIAASRSQFNPKKSRAIQEVTLLVAGSRQAAGLEEWTPLHTIREACADLGVDDRSNFATHIKSLTGIRQRGRGKTGEIKMNSVGFERASALIHEIGEAPA
jgi:hypothetical protein